MVKLLFEFRQLSHYRLKSIHSINKLKVFVASIMNKARIFIINHNVSLYLQSAFLVLSSEYNLWKFKFAQYC